MSDVEPQQPKTVGVVMVTHGEAGDAMVATVERLAGKIAGLLTVRVESGEAREAVEKRIETAAQSIGANEMVFLVDLVGSTPYRLCCQRCGGDSVVVTGVNLPMLFKLITVDRGVGAKAIAQELVATGMKSIQAIGIGKGQS